MNELIKVNYYNEQPTVSGRELHGFCRLAQPTKTGSPECANTDSKKEKTFAHF